MLSAVAVQVDPDAFEDDLLTVEWVDRGRLRSKVSAEQQGEIPMRLTAKMGCFRANFLIPSLITEHLKVMIPAICFQQSQRRINVRKRIFDLDRATE